MAQTINLADEFAPPDEAGAAKPSESVDLAQEFALPTTQSLEDDLRASGALPKKMDFSGLQRKKDEKIFAVPDLTQPIVTIPQLPELAPTDDEPLTALEKVGSSAAGVYNAGAKLVTSFTTLPNIALLLTTGGLGNAARAGSIPARRALVGISSYFAGAMAKDALEQIPEAKKAFDAPGATPQEKAEAVAAPVFTAAMSVLAALGAVHEARPDLTKFLKDKTPFEAETILKAEALKTENAQEKAVLQDAADQIATKTPAAETSPEPSVSSPAAEPVPTPEIAKTPPAKLEAVQNAIKDPEVTIQYNVWDRAMIPEGRSRVAQVDLPSPNAPRGGAGDGNWSSTNLELLRELGVDAPEAPEWLPPGRYTLDEIKAEIAKGPPKLAEEFTPPEAIVTEGPIEVGLGAASPAEFKPVKEFAVSLKNESIDKERSARGAPPLMEAAKKGFGETWDQAMRVVENNQNAADDLISTLKETPRAVTDVEQAVLLHREIDLKNQLEKASKNLAESTGTEDSLASDRLTRARVLDELSDLEAVSKSAGTETSRGLNARKLIAKEDYSLARMLTERRAERGGEALTEKEIADTEALHNKIKETQSAIEKHDAARLKAEKAKLERSTEKVLAKKDAEDFGTKPKHPREPVKLDDEGLLLKAENERAKQAYQEALLKDRLAKRTTLEKTQDTLVKWRRGFLLSSPITLAKLTSAAIQRMTITPIEELVGAGIGKLIPSVASRAPREGGINVTTEARAITQGLTKGLSDAAELIKTGKTNLEVLFGKGREGAIKESDVTPRSVIDFFGEIHGALKAPVKRAEFTRSLEKRMAFAIKNGIDATDPLVQTRLMVEAYKDANRSIFLQDNIVVNAYNRALGALLEKQKATGKPSTSGKVLATTAKVLLPIVRVPTNIVAETITNATGLVTGSFRLARILGQETKKLSPEQADLVMRELKKGTLGAAVLLIGYFNADKVGGYYQSGQKRSDKDVPYGSVKVYGNNVPSYLLHNPLIETLQLGATVRRVAESKLHKKDREAQGLDGGIWAAGLGLIEEVPFVRQQVETAKMLDSREGPYARGEFAKSLVVPQAVEFTARQLDKDAKGNVIQRKPSTTMQHIETAIPGLRKNVPKK